MNVEILSLTRVTTIDIVRPRGVSAAQCGGAWQPPDES